MTNEVDPGTLDDPAEAPVETPEAPEGGAPAEGESASAADDDAASTDSDGGTPAEPDKTRTSEHANWVKRYDNDPERAAREAFALEQRHKEARARLAELEAEVEARDQSEGTSDDDESIEIDYQALPDDVRAQVQQAETSDAECRRVSASYWDITQREAKIITFDQEGRVVGGELPLLDQRIWEAQALLNKLADPKQGMKALGLDDLGEFEASEVTNRLTKKSNDLKGELRDLKDQKRDLESLFERLRSARVRTLNEYQQLRLGLARRILAPSIAEQRKAEKAAHHDTLRKQFTAEWTQAYDTVCRELKIPKQQTKDKSSDYERLHRFLVKAAKGSGEVLMDQAAIEEFLRREAGDYLPALEHEPARDSGGRFGRRETISTSGSPGTTRPGTSERSAPVNVDELSESLRDQFNRGLRSRPARL